MKTIVTALTITIASATTISAASLECLPGTASIYNTTNGHWVSDVDESSTIFDQFLNSETYASNVAYELTPELVTKLDTRTPILVESKANGQNVFIRSGTYGDVTVRITEIIGETMTVFSGFCNTKFG